MEARFSAAGEPLIVVSSYTRFENLAHGPSGTEAKEAIWTFRLDTKSGGLVLLSVVEQPVCNPAFSRMHPFRSVMYACTESVVENGEIVALGVDTHSGELEILNSTDALGTSTCYITIDKEARNMLIVNYWDASIHVFRLDPRGRIVEHRSKYDPNEGRSMVAKAGLGFQGRVNHSENDASAQAERQADPHSHAIILDNIYGRIAYVPDLGADTVHQFLFDPDAGTLTPLGSFPSGTPGKTALGPRYIEFHPSLPVAYVINELSSEVAVFVFDVEEAEKMLAWSRQAGAVSKSANGKSPPQFKTLRLVQNISTIPDAWPRSKNTCGRITVHRSGDFVLCSNRGHDSIASFFIQHHSEPPGLLSLSTIQHTHGETPRHFAFDPSGEWLISANQDSDSVTVFRFNGARGEFTKQGDGYSVPSPNFVCPIDSRKYTKLSQASL
jgi:6-phosphogluconolactonase (cycloisomerase 2 family)